jgi:phenylacetate-CoA ligase
MNNKTHEILSRKILLPVWRGVRSARKQQRAPMRAFREGMTFRRATVQWSDEQKREWILNRLRFVVRRAARETPFYRELLARINFNTDEDFSFDDFARIPVLERDEVRRAGRSLVSERMSESEMIKDATGGSTGEPTEVWLGAEEQGWRESGLEYWRERVGAPTGVRTIFFWGHHLDPHATDSWRDRYHAFESNARWFDCFRLSEEKLEEYHREFTRLRPALILAYAGALSSLAEYLEARGVKNPAYPTRCFITGAEKLWPREREIIERVFAGRPVYERYGSRDVGLIGMQTNAPRSLDFEIDWSSVLLEPETNDEESSILVTKLRADAMPMIRYRIGDMGRFTEADKPGYPALRVREIMGRETDRIWLPDGRWVNGLEMPHMMKSYPVREFMFRQRADYSIELQVVPQNGFNEEARRSIIETVSANLPSLDVVLNLVDEIARTRANKRRFVVTEVVLPAQRNEAK